MKYLKSINLLVLLALLLMNYSCSVEKKLYSHGYYVKWHHSAKNSKSINLDAPSNSNGKAIQVTSNKEVSTQAFNDDEFSVLYKSEPGVSVIQEIETQKASLCSVSQEQEPTQTKYRINEAAKGINMAKALVTDVKPVAENQRMHGLAVAGFVLALVGWFTPVNIALILLILGVVFAAIALGSISKNPEMYKGSGLAIAAFVVALIGVIILFAL